MSLKEILEKNQLSQAWLAGEIALSKASVNLIVKYGKFPTKPARLVIVDAITAAFKTKNIDLAESIFSTTQ